MRCRTVLSLTLLLSMAACGGGKQSAPRPVATTDVSGLHLVPYIDRELGLSGSVPEGWFEALPGVFLAGVPGDRPGTALIQRVEGGVTLDQVAAAWQGLLDLDEFPEPVGRRQTASLTWTLYTFQAKDPELGMRRGDMAFAETEDGIYLVVLATTAGEYATLHDEVFMPSVDALAPAGDDSAQYERYADWPVVAAVEAVANHEQESIEFVLEECTRLRVYAIGEGTQQGMDDFGYVEDAGTGQVVWQMYFFETDAAGYHKNRRVDRPLTLPAGTYRLHFQTNGSHSFGDWGDRAPGHRYWGITLYADPDPESGPAVCWGRAENPEELGWSSEGLDQLKPEAEQMGAAALMVVTDGQVVLEWGNTANNFQAHSMRKSLMSALYGIYSAEGTIDVSETLDALGIDDIVPLTEAERQATVADLLRARSGVYIPAAGEAQSMKDARPKRGSHEPGSHWYYSNWDFNTLGTIFEQESGQNIFQAFEERIGEPVGMQEFVKERLQYTYEYWLSQHPYYGFRISARDLARFGQLFLQKGSWQDMQVIPASWVEESTRPYSQTGQSGTYGGYGYMWWIATKDDRGIKEGSYAASGHGGHTLEVLPDLDTVIVFRVNTDAPGFQPLSDPDRLVRRILQARE